MSLYHDNLNFQWHYGFCLINVPKIKSHNLSEKATLFWSDTIAPNSQMHWEENTDY